MLRHFLAFFIYTYSIDKNETTLILFLD